MDIKKNILQVFSANVICLLLGILTNFLLPRELDITQYANLKTFNLYCGYIGVLHFGFIDGMYIKYGGKEVEDINKEELNGEVRFLKIFQTIITVVLMIISILLSNIMLFLVALAVYPNNLKMLHSLFFQATGQFKKYSKITSLTSLINFGIIFLLLYCWKIKNGIIYCIAYLFVYFLISMILNISYRKQNCKYKTIINKKDIQINFKIGIIILIANSSLILFYGIDSWFIKLFFNEEIFAYYSFAISMMNVINVAITAVAITLYNYLVNNNTEQKVREIKNMFLLVSTLASSGYFIFAFIVNLIIPQYVESLKIIAILFAAYPYKIMIKSLYVNLYNANKDEKKYLKVVVKMLILATCLNIIGMLIVKHYLVIAFATLLSFIIWYFYSMKDFKGLKATKKEVSYLAIVLMLFLFSANVLHYYWGGLVYISSILILNILFYKKEIINMVKILKK